jgi:hypothetical protein
MQVNVFRVSCYVCSPIFRFGNELKDDLATTVPWKLVIVCVVLDMIQRVKHQSKKNLESGVVFLLYEKQVHSGVCLYTHIFATKVV